MNILDAIKVIVNYNTETIEPSEKELRLKQYNEAHNFINTLPYHTRKTTLEIIRRNINDRFDLVYAPQKHSDED
jgi:hypothetical protein